MIRSLRTGVSGLKSNQTRMDVVGNNIANINTIAFKRARVAFNEVLGQQLLGVGRTAGGTGINPSYVGLGVAVGSIDQNWSQGALKNTGVATDLALNGDGFFIARAGDRTLLTRAGNFTFNSEGQLVTANGLNVQGWKFNEQGELLTGALKDIEVDFNAQAPAQYTGNASVGGNLSADTPIDGITSVSSIVYDEQGKAHTVVIDFEKTADNTWEYSLDAAENTTSPFNGGPVTGTVVFNTDGSIDTANSDLPPEITWGAGFVDTDGDGNAEETLTIDLSSITQYSGSTTTTVREQDGHASGTIVGFSINPEGILELNFSNGEQKQLFQLTIGNVNNPNGLQQRGENFYSTTSASGDLQLARAGRDLETAVVAGTLEMSNVDLATEFTEMIVAQRGYQAAARVITTSDELLQEAVQLKR